MLPSVLWPAVSILHLRGSSLRFWLIGWLAVDTRRLMDEELCVPGFGP